MAENAPPLYGERSPAHIPLLSALQLERSVASKPKASGRHGIQQTSSIHRVNRPIYLMPSIIRDLTLGRVEMMASYFNRVGASSALFRSALRSERT